MSIILSSQWHAKQGIPVIFLHGLLGSQHDWNEVLSLLQNFPKIRPLTLDLPFHGLSSHITCDGFAEIRAQLQHSLTHLIGLQPFYLVGYSLGGRVALDYLLNVSAPNLKGTILEGANIGLTSEKEREARFQNDLNWANRFHHEPIEIVLRDWYQQPIFADLTDVQRDEYIANRQHNQGSQIAKMLEATSLAKQKNYVQQLKAFQKNVIFFVGEQDSKFRKMVEKYHLPTEIIQNAGHNTHRSNAPEFVEKLLDFIKI